MAVNKSLASSSLAEVVDRILDKGVVVDAFVRIALVGIELISIELRVVIASVETYLRYAEAVGLTTYYWTYATFRAARRLYIEDLFIRGLRMIAGFRPHRVTELPRRPLYREDSK